MYESPAWPLPQLPWETPKNDIEREKGQNPVDSLYKVMTIFSLLNGQDTENIYYYETTTDWKVSIL